MLANHGDEIFDSIITARFMSAGIWTGFCHGCSTTAVRSKLGATFG